jgi:ribosomal protein S18 acetylase RimI-like enzyme
VPEAAHVRAATPADVRALLRLKRQLAIVEKAELALRATEGDWLRDGFGPRAQFTAFVAEHAGTIVGMVTASERYYTSWAGCTLYIQDIYVDPPHRGRGIGTALLGCVAALAIERGSPLVELTVRADNRARRLYRRVGFQQIDCASYVAAGAALAALAEAMRARRRGGAPAVTAAGSPRPAGRRSPPGRWRGR